MTQVSDRLASLSPSATLAMSQKSNELKAQGIDGKKEILTGNRLLMNRKMIRFVRFMLTGRMANRIAG